jgi:hypothetical protein
MSTRPPPVPPANRSPKGPENAQRPDAKTAPPERPVPNNTAEQGRQGNISQNTHNQGYQQDR